MESWYRDLRFFNKDIREFSGKFSGVEKEKKHLKATSPRIFRLMKDFDF